MYGTILLIHILSATIWTGGHLVIALTVLPRVLREKAPQELLKFESRYEYIGIPSLLLQLITGVWLAYRLIPDVSQWFAFDNPVTTLIFVKLMLLLATLIFAADARFRLIPNLTERNLKALAYHIIPVTVISVLFVVIGVSFRTGWFY